MCRVRKMNQFEASACACDACTNIVFGWNAICPFCQQHCIRNDGGGPLPFELRQFHHTRHIFTELHGHERDRAVRHSALKLGAKFIAKTVDPSIVSNAKQLVQAAWNLAKAWRGK